MRKAFVPSVLVLALTLAVGIAAAKTVKGTNASEVLGGTPKDDKIIAKGGNDYIGGNDGDDKIIAGNGNDQLYGLRGKDVTKGGKGNDRLSEFDNLGSGPVAIRALRYQRRGGGEDLPGADRMFGGPGSDYLEGSLGGDTERGGPGSDQFFGDPGPDRIFGGPGNDEMEGEEGPDTMSGGTGDDRIDAVNDDTGAVDKITCGPGNDAVAASEEDDVSTVDCEFIGPSLPPEM